MNLYEKTIGVRRVLSMIERKVRSIDDFVDHISPHVPEIKSSPEYHEMIEAMDNYVNSLKTIHANYQNKYVKSKKQP